MYVFRGWALRVLDYWGSTLNPKPLNRFGFSVFEVQGLMGFKFRVALHFLSQTPSRMHHCCCFQVFEVDAGV